MRTFHMIFFNEGQLKKRPCYYSQNKSNWTLLRLELRCFVKGLQEDLPFVLYHARTREGK